MKIRKEELVRTSTRLLPPFLLLCFHPGFSFQFMRKFLLFVLWINEQHLHVVTGGGCKDCGVQLNQYQNRTCDTICIFIEVGSNVNFEKQTKKIKEKPPKCEKSAPHHSLPFHFQEPHPLNLINQEDYIISFFTYLPFYFTKFYSTFICFGATSRCYS